MNVLQPSFLWLLLLALPLILLYTLRRKRRVTRVPAVFLWQQATGPVQWRWKLLGRLDRRLLALLLFLVALVGVVAGMARVGSQQPEPRDVVVVVDVSGSMAARFERGTRLEEAHRIIEDLRRNLPRGSSLWVVTAGDQARVVQGPGVAQPTDPIRTEGGGADLAGGLELAYQLLAEQSPERDREVWVISDGDEGTLPPPPEGVLVRYTAPPAGRANLRVEGWLQVEDEQRLLLRSWVENSGEEPWEARPRIDLDGAPYLRLPARTVQPGERLRLPDQRIPRTTRVELRLLKPDDQPVDDSVGWVVPPAPPLQVLLHDPHQNRFLRAALASDARVVVHQAPRADTTYDVLVCSAPAPEGWSAKGRLDLGIPPDRGLTAHGDRRGPGVVRARAHPVLRGVDLDDLLVSVVPRLSVESGWAPVATAGDVPFLLVRDDGSSRAVVLTIALETSDLALRRAFPLLVANTVRWVAHRTGEAPRWVGAGHQVRLSGSGPIDSPTGPLDGWKEPPPHFPAVHGPGLYSVDSQPQVAVHSDPRESRLSVREDLGLGERAAGELPEQPNDPWRLWVLVAVVALLIEGVIFHSWGLP